MLALALVLLSVSGGVSVVSTGPEACGPQLVREIQRLPQVDDAVAVGLSRRPDGRWSLAVTRDGVRALERTLENGACADVALAASLVVERFIREIRVEGTLDAAKRARARAAAAGDAAAVDAGSLARARPTQSPRDAGTGASARAPRLAADAGTTPRVETTAARFDGGITPRVETLSAAAVDAGTTARVENVVVVPLDSGTVAASTESTDGGRSDGVPAFFAEPVLVSAEPTPPSSPTTSRSTVRVARIELFANAGALISSTIHPTVGFELGLRFSPAWRLALFGQLGLTTASSDIVITGETVPRGTLTTRPLQLLLSGGRCFGDRLSGCIELLAGTRAALGWTSGPQLYQTRSGSLARPSVGLQLSGHWLPIGSFAAALSLYGLVQPVSGTFAIEGATQTATIPLVEGGVRLSVGAALQR